MKETKNLNIIKTNSTVKKEWIKPFLNCLDITRTENGSTADSSEGVWFFLPGSDS